MELNDYQNKAMSTCMASSANFSYMMMNLVGEVGEFASKVAKSIRKERSQINNSDLFINKEDEVELQKEAGDILWQISGLCNVLGWSLDEIAEQNINKLASRKDRGVIDGNGDNR